MTSARVFIHPRCWPNENGADNSPHEALADALEKVMNLDHILIGPLDSRRRRELVRFIHDQDATTTYERMDGTRFQHRMGQDVTIEPEVA
jgi:hypothetical protein